MKKSATISDCNRYRYELHREWDKDKEKVLKNACSTLKIPAYFLNYNISNLSDGEFRWILNWRLTSFIKNLEYGFDLNYNTTFIFYIIHSICKT